MFFCLFSWKKVPEWNSSAAANSTCRSTQQRKSYRPFIQHAKEKNPVFHCFSICLGKQHKLCGHSVIHSHVLPGKSHSLGLLRSLLPQSCNFQLRTSRLNGKDIQVLSQCKLRRNGSFRHSPVMVQRQGLDFLISHTFLPKEMSVRFQNFIETQSHSYIQIKYDMLTKCFNENV